MQTESTTNDHIKLEKLKLDLIEARELAERYRDRYEQQNRGTTPIWFPWEKEKW